MRLINIEHSQLITLFAAARPEGNLSVPRVVQLLTERYQFSGFPTKLEDLAKSSVSFRQGSFNGHPIDAFDIHSDGVVMKSKTPTAILDAFLEDLCAWMEETVGLERVKTHEVDKNYESQLVVQCEAPLLRALDALAPIQELLSKALAKATKLSVPFHGVALGIGPDYSKIAGMKPNVFRLERRAEVPFEANFYYSAAPIGTADHLAILERIEKSVRCLPARPRC